MNERDGLFLNHIFGAITDIESFMVAQDRVGFLADRKTQSAVIRQLEIIGEEVETEPETEPGIDWLAHRRAVAADRRYARSTDPCLHPG